MGKSWNYAQLSHFFKGLGGPEKGMRYIAAYNRRKGRQDMIPSLLSMLGLGFGFGVIADQLVNYLEEKQHESDEAYERAKKEIIDGVKQYEREHPDE